MTQATAEPRSVWYSDWQSAGHAGLFDARSVLSPRSLIRNYESFNDVRILGEWLAASSGPATLLEVGCATGEFHRYLRLAHPQVEYHGVDISRPAIAKACEKYPQGRFYVTRPEAAIGQEMASLGIPARPEVLYSKDVVHHQTDPYGFLSQLLEIPSRLLVLRTRTRDQGPTVLDPDLSCQYHYQGWMPYIVLNLDELLGQIHSRVPQAEILATRNRMILGGRENRYLPKDCYLPETGTAETSVGIFLHPEQPGRIQVADRREEPAPVPFSDRVALLLGRMRGHGR